ncbi:MAG: AbrB family transcriptional regulator [Clostridia bacterium]|nr:AbrB family transcriptional regulator [Clostridia bacterium]
MKSTGIVRGVDYAGRVILPQGLCSNLGIVRGEDALEIFVDGENIVLKKYRPGCVFCGSADELSEFKGEKICISCRRELLNFIEN